MASKHTPGAWVVSEGIKIDYEPMCWSVTGPPSDFMFLTNEADARLIAAAPELYEALQLAYAHLCGLLGDPAAFSNDWQLSTAMVASVLKGWLATVEKE